MIIIRRYLSSSVLYNTVFILFIVSSLLAILQLFNETREIGVGQYTLVGAIAYVLLTTPQQIYAVFPIASLFGCMLSCVLLARHSELTILRVSGFSLSKLLCALSTAMFSLVVLAFLIGEVLAPWCAQLAEQHKVLLTSNGQALTTQQGSIWIRDASNFIYIQTVVSPKHLIQVQRYEFNKEGQLVSASSAQQLIYTSGHWQAYTVKTTQLAATKIRSYQFAQQIWPLAFTPRLLTSSMITPEQMSLKQLWAAIHYRQNNYLNVSQMAFTFWQRVIHPWTILLMLSLGLTFSITHARIQSFKVLLGIMLGVGFYLSNVLFGPFVLLYQWPPLLAASLPALVFLSITLILGYRTRS